MKLEARGVDEEQTRPEHGRPVKLEARGLGVRYSADAPRAVDGVSFAVEAGLTVLVGPNGCGKTTLLRLLLGSLRPQSGSALMDGREVSEWDARERARGVGVVPQSEEFPFPLSVRDLAAMGRYPHIGSLRALKKRDWTAVESALAECDLAELAERDIGTLSGGERQRARIARALAQRPRALVLDEPTASLDLGHGIQIFGLLRREAARGRTVVVVTHDLELAARFADRLLLLDSGRVVADGTPAEVMTAERMSRAYRWPVAVASDPISGALRITPLDGGQVGEGG